MSTSEGESAPRKAREYLEEGEPLHTFPTSSHRFHQSSIRGGSQGRSRGGSGIVARLTKEVVAMAKNMSIT